MSLLVVDCPHCGTANSGMIVFGAKTWPSEQRVQVGHNQNSMQPVFVWKIDVAAQCQSCSKPVCSVVDTRDLKKASYDHQHSAYATENEKRLLGPGDVLSLGYEFSDVWPTSPEPEIPAHVPPSVEKAMLQAERNFPIVGNEEAAALMYRRSLELALKDLHPKSEGTLAGRIRKLVSSGDLPKAMGDWANEIRELGNDAAHDATEVSRAELTTIRGFADATLRYLYSLPAEVAARRKTPANS